MTNEVTTLDRDIFVLANPEIGGLPGWVIGLVVAGGLAAALSTAAGLLMVISSAVSHDLCRKVLFKNMSDTQELLVAGLAAVGRCLWRSMPASTRPASWPRLWPSPSVWPRPASSRRSSWAFSGSA
jgi:Na+(H+)/acetate symporter ActP